MKKLIAPLIALSVLVGCGGNVCERSRDVYAEKVRECPALADMATEASENECEEQLDSCSGDDIQGINKGLDCVQTLPNCVASDDGSSEFGFIVGVLGCFSNRGISDQCTAY